MLGGCDPEIVLPLPADLAATQRDQIDGVACEMPRVHGPAGAARNQRGLALTRAQAFLDPEDLSRDLDRALDHPNRVGVHAVAPITRQLAETKGQRLPHQERDHARAGRWGRGGWRTAHERRQLVPGAQEAERIGVPPPHHGGRPGGGEARDQRDVAVEAR